MFPKITVEIGRLNVFPKITVEIIFYHQHSFFAFFYTPLLFFSTDIYIKEGHSFMEKTNTHHTYHLLICLICLSSSIKVQQVKYRLRYQYKNYKSSEGKVLKFNLLWYFFIPENILGYNSWTVFQNLTWIKLCVDKVSDSPTTFFVS